MPTIRNLPADLRKALASDARALAAWEDITPLVRNEWICWTISVKKDETRRQRVERVCSELKEGMRRLGATREEISEALGVAVAMNAGAALIYSTRVLDAVSGQDNASAKCLEGNSRS